MELRDISMEDLPFYERLLTDPVVMAELGGPLPREMLPEKLRGIVEDVRGGSIWYSVIVLDDGSAAGTVCIWEHEWRGGTISEIGWMVAPEFQGRGVGTEAVRMILERARSESRWGAVHALPGITNPASNAICRKTGFAKLEEVDIDYLGRPLRCNLWRLDPASGSSPA